MKNFIYNIGGNIRKFYECYLITIMAHVILALLFDFMIVIAGISIVETQMKDGLIIPMFITGVVVGMAMVIFNEMLYKDMKGEIKYNIKNFIFDK